MPVIAVETSKEDRELYDQWKEDKVSGARLLKDFTECVYDPEKGLHNKILLIKKGTKSHKYEHCYFYFISEEGIEVLINVGTVCRNENYFEKIPINQQVNEKLQKAMEDETWKNHKLGDMYSMMNVGGKKDSGIWRIAYYPLFGTYKGDADNKQWIEFDEPRALIENKLPEGSDFREMPLRYLSKNITQ